MDNIKMNESDDFVCEFCDSKFALKRTLSTHIKTSKKCIVSRPKINISCIWCRGTFVSKEDLEKHHKRCEADKNILYIQSLDETKNKDNIIKEKEKEIDRLNNIIKEKDKQIENIIKDLTSKVNSSNTTTTNNINNPVTYNITLNCAKPLLLSKERIIRLMDRTCEPYYIKRGQEGLADWFLNEVCRNDNSDICIECTDKTRKKFRYEDEYDVPKEITGFSLTQLLRSCIPSFKNTIYYKQTKEECGEDITRYDTLTIYNAILDFEKPGNKFINYLVDKTHNDSVNCLLTKRA